jgi:hypothetical protein
MSKSILAQQESRRPRKGEREEEPGRHFRLLRNIDGRQYGPLYFANEDEARSKGDDAASNSKPVPSDYYERHLTRFKVWRAGSTRSVGWKHDLGCRAAATPGSRTDP